MNKKVIIIGAGGHARVIEDIILKTGDSIVGFLDDNVTGKLDGIPILGKIKEANDIYEKYPASKFIIAIGNNNIRKEISQKYLLPYYTAIHPNSIIANNVRIKEGSVIMAGSCINPYVTIGTHVIINTGAIVEHNCEIADFVHISPRGVLGGTVYVGEATHIGIGAVVKNNIKIEKDIIVGAGAVVVKDIQESGTYIGVPAQKKKEKVII